MICSSIDKFRMCGIFLWKKGGKLVAKLKLEAIQNTDGQFVINEIIKWQAELDDDLVDSIVYETLETVIDIIYENSECI